MIIPAENGYVLTASENGYGKRTPVNDFPVKGRGGQGVIAMQSSSRNGQMVGAVQVFGGDELMLISTMGTLVRTAADEVSELSRNTQGVRLINVKEGELVNSVARIAEQEDISDPGADADNGDEASDETD